MIVLEIEMAVELGELFARVVDRAMERMGEGLPREMQEPADRELAEIWSEDLRAKLRADAQCLMDLLGHEKFGHGELTLDEEAAEAICRAASAVRLGVRETELRGVPDALLERGAGDPETLERRDREAYYCYWFLGGLQEMLVRALDPESSESALSEDFEEPGDDGAEAPPEDD